jgi:O-antigen/teichoic acid export membrane protein
LALKLDFLWVGGGRLVSALLALLAIRAVTTLLTPEQYGELALLLTIQMFCGLFLINPVGQHVNLHTHAWWDDGTLIARLKSYRQYIFVVSLVGLFVVLGINKQSSLINLFWSAAAMFAMVVAGTWNATLIPILNMLGFRAASVSWGIVTVAVGLVVSVTITFWLPSATAWFAGQFIGMAVGALGAKYFLKQQVKTVNASENSLPLLNKKVVLTYCLPLAVATGLMWLQLSGYRFLIDSYWGLAQLGFLAVGLQLAGQIWSLAESLAMQFLYPLFYRRVTEYDDHETVELAYSDLLNTLVPVYIVLTGLLILSAPYLLKVLVSAQYQDSMTFVMLGAGIELCRVLGNLLSNAAHVKRNTKALTAPYAVGALVSLTLIYLAGVRDMEINWAATGLLAGASTMLLAMGVLMYRQIRFSIDIMRCAAAGIAMLLMFQLSVWLPKLSGILENIGMLVALGLFGGAFVFVLLRHNPATLRLLSVSLQKN